MKGIIEKAKGVLGQFSPPDPKKPVREAVRCIRENALHADKIDWNAVAIPDPIESLAQAHEFIECLLGRLEDGHSHLVTRQLAAQRYASTLEVPGVSFVPSTAGLLGCVTVPGFLETEQLSQAQYVNAIRDALKACRHREVAGRVIDLRSNFGGNMWPMLAGLYEVLEGPLVGYFGMRNHKQLAWSVEKGFAKLDGKTIAGTFLPEPTGPLLPLAFITGGATCSSGEAIAIALKGCGRHFGAPTEGLSTGNEPFQLSCGSVLWLTTCVFVDRHGVQYGQKITPDQYVPPDTADEKLFEGIAQWMVDWPNGTAS